jgi:hypothetical protein
MRSSLAFHALLVRVAIRRGNTHIMPDILIRAARYHERAAECIKLANASFDQPMEVRYRLLAERYIKLAECEEVLEGQDQNTAG